MSEYEYLKKNSHQNNWNHWNDRPRSKKTREEFLEELEKDRLEAEEQLRIHKKEIEEQKEKSSALSPDTETKIQNLNNGKPLDKNTQEFFEEQFDQDFSKVKVHTDKEAAETAEQLNAKAYAKGEHIVFNENEYSPKTSEGKELIAHELAHIVQEKDTDTISRKPKDKEDEHYTFDYGFDKDMGAFYVVAKKGASLWDLSVEIYGSGQYYTEIAKLNNIEDADKIAIDEVIYIPYIKNLPKAEQDHYIQKIAEITVVGMYPEERKKIIEALKEKKGKSLNWQSIPQMKPIKIIPSIPKFEYKGNFNDVAAMIDNIAINLINGTFDIVNGISSEIKYIYDNGIVNYGKGLYLTYKDMGESIANTARTIIKNTIETPIEKQLQDTLMIYQDPQYWEQVLTIIAALVLTKKGTIKTKINSIATRDIRGLKITKERLKGFRERITSKIKGKGSKLHRDIPIWKLGDPAMGILKYSNVEIPLKSGSQGYGEILKTLLGGKGSGLNAQIISHVEGHTAGLMHKYGIKKATLFINKAPCATGAMCRYNLHKILPAGSKLIVKFLESDGKTIKTWLFEHGKPKWIEIK